MDLRTALVADAQAAEVVQMREAALNYPALAAQAGAVVDAAASDQRLDATPAQQPTVLIVVIAAVGQHPVGFATRPAALACDWPGVQGVQQWDQLGDVVAVTAGQRDRQWNARRVDQQVVF